jgi:hypothetical protein
MERNKHIRHPEAESWWLTFVILATWEAEIGRFKFKASSGK